MGGVMGPSLFLLVILSVYLEKGEVLKEKMGRLLFFLTSV
jgi:hypothetical protein